MQHRCNCLSLKLPMFLLNYGSIYDLLQEAVSRGKICIVIREIRCHPERKKWCPFHDQQLCFYWHEKCIHTDFWFLGRKYLVGNCIDNGLPTFVEVTYATSLLLLFIAKMGPFLSPPKWQRILSMFRYESAYRPIISNPLKHVWIERM